VKSDGALFVVLRKSFCFGQIRLEIKKYEQRASKNSQLYT